jgi:hypothetical protein
MVAGNGDADGQIMNPDKNETWQSQYGTSGYKTADYNMDGTVNMTDKNAFWNFNSGKCSMVPH